MDEKDELQGSCAGEVPVSCPREMLIDPEGYTVGENISGFFYRLLTTLTPMSQG